MSISTGKLFQNIFFLLIFTISFIPIVNRFRNLGIMQVQLDHFVLAIFLILVLPLLKVNIKVKSATKIYWLFIVILLWAFISTFWVNYYVDYRYIVDPLLMSFVCITLPFLFSKVIYFQSINWNKLVTNFSIILTIVFGYYIYKFYATDSFRLNGLLGGAAIIHIIMLPTLAVHLSNFQKNKSFLSIIFAFITTFALFLTGSRAGLLCLVIFLLFFLFHKMKARSFFPTVILLAIIAYFVLNTVSLQRYNNFEDSYRQVNLNTSMRIVSEYPLNILIGKGYGSVWPWYAFERNQNATLQADFVNSQWGPLLYHSHSVFLELFVELGLIGLIPFLIIIYILFKEFLKIRQSKNLLQTNLMWALISTLPAFFTDLYLFKNWYISVLWWSFLFFAISFKDKESEKPS